ncbi:hypothetical protein MTR_4g092565 [Medicago truncatula]|uniref:Uncharacterized protein n=1 Tax=Medicago truncatula TaxID=3880 RepID=A0A072UP90_MEDTR|nr:hypothetical protein MTR_4g092565 [Medicago truncatula]
MQIRVTTAGGKMKPTAVHLVQRLVRVTGYSDAGLVGRKRALEKDFGVVLVIGKELKERRRIGNITLPVPTTAAP